MSLFGWYWITTSHKDIFLCGCCSPKTNICFSFPLLTPLPAWPPLIKLRFIMPRTSDSSRGSQSNKFRSTCGSFQGQEGVALALASRHLAQWPTSSGIWSGHFAEVVHATNCPSVSVLTAKSENKRSEMPAAFNLLTWFDGLLVFLPPQICFGNCLTKRNWFFQTASS